MMHASPSPEPVYSQLQPDELLTSAMSYCEVFMKPTNHKEMLTGKQLYFTFCEEFIHKGGWLN